MSGRVFLVGAGPWDPSLITLRGRACLAEADIVLYDYLVNPAILRWAKPEAQQVCVGRPPTRMTQTEICRYLVGQANQGHTVVRLKGGDPFVFGRGGEEAQALAAAAIPFEVVPGVTAAVASAAYAGIPVTHRDYGSTLAFCTGHQREDGPDDDLNWSALAAMDTIVFYMAARRLARLRDHLIAAGRAPATPVALVQWATSPRQRTIETTLGELLQTIEKSSISAPIIVVIGEVVELRSAIQWVEQRPLHHRRIVVTRSREQADSMVGAIEDLGGEAIHYPVIQFERMPSELIDQAVDDLRAYDWVVFTSTNGVRFFLEAVFEKGLDARVFGQTKLACIGPATADALTRWGLKADLVPNEFIAESLLASLTRQGVAGARICIPRARVARPQLPAGLRAAGAQVDVVPVYETTMATSRPVDMFSETAKVDLISFTAASTVKNFCAAVDTSQLAVIMRTVPAACIGPITAEAARSAGFRVDVVADEYTIPGLVAAIETWGRRHKGKETE
ncbi:MAG: uroporphyrinogen-III C-methyltransferase [Myxococcota bacterium]|nr:uroporphyrinogen-III C-methyltransferase [Myxococcota bacterium]